MDKKFNIYKFLKDRPMSFSSFNTFSDPQWGSPERWYEVYILGKKQKSKALDLGSIIDKRFQEDLTFLPEVPRYVTQHKMAAVLELGKKKVHLVGITDVYKPTPRHLILDLKTGKKGTYQWTQKKADETKQLTFYALLLWLTEGIRPEEVDFEICWIASYEKADLSVGLVEPFEVVRFKTKRTTLDILKLCGEIQKTVKAMQKYVDTCNRKVYNKAKVER